MTDTDATLVEFFTNHHRECDAHWARVEAAVEAGDAGLIAEEWKKYDRIQRLHLDMEEQAMFPAFEAATGMTGGPTQVMRMEHDQMRGVLKQMAAAAEQADFEELVDQGDTLLMLIQQHNQKEEGILYPMASQALTGQWPELREKLLQMG